MIQLSEAPKSGLPDLDEFFRKLKPGFAKKNRDPFQSRKAGLRWWVFIILLLLLVLIGFSSMITVKPGELLVVTRFGAYYKTDHPGLHWTIPVVDQRIIMDMQATQTVSYQAQNLTQDGVLIKASVNLAYQVTDPKAYLFAGNAPGVIQSALSQAATVVILKSSFVDLLNNANWKQIANNITANVGDLSRYGIKVTGVEVQNMQVPDALSHDFDATIANAQSQAAQMVQDANTFAKTLVPLSAQKAANAISYADAEKFAAMVNATRDAAEFSSLVPAYNTDAAATLAYLPLLLTNNWKSIQAVSTADADSRSRPINMSEARYLRWQSASDQQQAEEANNEEN